MTFSRRAALAAPFAPFLRAQTDRKSVV